MKCITCGTEMICKNDVNDVNTRIDWVKCPKCRSEAEVTYDIDKGYINKVVWER